MAVEPSHRAEKESGRRHTQAHTTGPTRRPGLGLGQSPASCALPVWYFTSYRTRADSDELGQIGEP